MGELYDEDFVAWTEQQAAALRGRLPTNALDIDNLAEEVEDLGMREVRKVESLVEAILLHALKIALQPGSPDVRHWRGEMVAFHNGIRRAFSPSMLGKIDMDGLWQDALKVFAEEYGADRSRSEHTAVWETLRGSPVDMQSLFQDRLDLDRLLKRVAAAAEIWL